VAQVSGALDSIAAAAAVEVTVQSAHGPFLRWTPDPDSKAAPSGSSAAGGSSWSIGKWLAGLVGRFLKPSVTIHTAFGTVHRAPYGEPDATTWPALAVVLALGTVTVVTFAAIGVASLVRRR
jgi:hypothetical protein